jgi:NAD(P)H-dependent FMN reductase
VKIGVISTSLSPASKSRAAARWVAGYLQTTGHVPVEMDMTAYKLPFCDGYSAVNDSVVQEFRSQIQSLDGVIIATPIYNYDGNAVLKNVLELTGRTWMHKVVGLICAAGGSNSYMAPMGVISGLMLDFRCVVVPRYVYLTSANFDTDLVPLPEIQGRLSELAQTVVSFSDRLKDYVRQPVLK